MSDSYERGANILDKYLSFFYDCITSLCAGDSSTDFNTATAVQTWAETIGPLKV